jgi:trimethylamine:corrinoid methyltransferase-like protein
MAAAEVMGGMIAMRHVTDKPVTFGVNIFPFDLRAGAMVFGSPENLLYQMLCADFNRFYGWERERGPSNIHVMSKLPDAQAAADKAAIMSLGASLGARHFGSAGTLSLDEIFSPEQLLVDCEIRDWVQRAVRGLGVEQTWRSDAQRLEELAEGVRRGFMGQESTLADYLLHRQGGGSIWYPRHFQRAPVGPWLAAGEPRLSARLRDDVRRRIGRHDFELDRERQAEIERIYLSAMRAVSDQADWGAPR